METAKIPVFGSCVNDINESTTSSILEALSGPTGLAVGFIVVLEFNNQYCCISKLIAVAEDNDWNRSIKDVLFGSCGININFDKKLGSE